MPQSPLLSETYYRLGTIQYNILQDFDRAQVLLKTALKNNPPDILKLKEEVNLFSKDLYFPTQLEF